MQPRIHVTKDGDSMLVAQMENTHLLHMIRKALRTINKVYQASKSTDDEYRSRLYGKMRVSPEQAADLVNRSLEELAPYFVEAFFRLPEIVADNYLLQIYMDCNKIMIDLFQREGQLEKFDISLPLLSGGSNWEPNDEDDDGEGMEPF